METSSCSVSSDRMSIGRRGGVVGLAASGVMGLRECLGALARVQEAAAGADAVVVDLRHVAFTLSAADYVQVVRSAMSDPLHMPVAFVVSKAIMPFAFVHAAAMRRRGFARRSFASPDSAARWLSRSRRTR
jgi:hypothetical protein